MCKFLLAIRFLLRRRVSYFAVAATGLCVFVAFVVITSFSGVTARFKDYIHDCYGDCVLSTKSLVGFGHYEQFIEVLESAEIVEAVSPVIKGYAQIRTIYGSYGVGQMNRPANKFVGIDPLAHSKVTGFGRWLGLHKDDPSVAFEAEDSNVPGCVPGAGFLFDWDPNNKKLDIGEEFPQVRFEVSVFPLTAKGAPLKAGLGEVSTKTFYCSDYIYTKYISDWTIFSVPFEEAQRLCGMDTEPRRINELYVKFKPGVALEAGRVEVARLWEKYRKGKAGAQGANLLENVRVQSWKTHNRAIIAVTETQQTFMIVIFGLVGIITVFIVFVVFYMIVSHKSKDIGILKSIGVSNSGVLGLFIAFSLLIGMLGSLLGALGGWQFLIHIEQIHGWFEGVFDYGLSIPGEFAIEDIPNQINFGILSIIIVSAICACLIGALIPSWQAARKQPVEVLQVSGL